MIDFTNVKDWGIPEGPVEQVEDSQGRVIWEKDPIPDEPFYIENPNNEDITIRVGRNNTSSPTFAVYYSANGTNWTNAGTIGTDTVDIPIPAGEKRYIYGNTSKWCNMLSTETAPTKYNYLYSLNSKPFNIGGRLSSIVNNDYYGDRGKFAYLFRNTKLVDASKLIMTSSGNSYGYYGLFSGCSSLTKPPKRIGRNATSVHTGEYGMCFSGCSNMTYTPVIRVSSSINERGMYHMFYSCSNLTYNYVDLSGVSYLFPEACYEMFYGCTSLTTAPALPATTLADSCYYRMFRGCTSLTTAPALPATTLASSCYNSMFYGCTSLAAAPVLPATTLVNQCYRYMFYGCSKLNKVTTYAQDISASYCIDNWLGNVAPTGDFYNYGTATYTIDSASGVPVGWTYHNFQTDAFYVEDASGQQNTLQIVKNNNLAPTVEVFKSTDGENWQSMGSTSDTAITATIPANGKLYLRAAINQWGVDGAYYNSINCTGDFNIGGNIMSLINGGNYRGTDLTNNNNYAFFALFANANVINANNLILPINCVTGAFGKMFYNSQLTTAPDMHNVTSVGDDGCTQMFNATKITSMSDLNMINIGNRGFQRMFAYSKIVTAPNIKVKTMGYAGMHEMFIGCDQLTTPPQKLSVTYVPTSGYQQMFYMCTSMLTTPNIASINTIGDSGCRDMFAYCSSLTQGGNMYISRIDDKGCWGMYMSCSSLSSLEVELPYNRPETAITDWLRSVNSTGTLYNVTGIPLPSGPSGIPTGWTEVVGPRP